MLFSGGATRTATSRLSERPIPHDVSKNKSDTLCVPLSFLEAPPGIGPGIKVLQTSALPLGYGAVFSSERGREAPLFRNPSRQGRGSAPFGDPRACLNEKRARKFRAREWSGLRGSNPPPPPWQGGALPNELNPRNGASGRNRTNDTGIFSPLLYQLSYRGLLSKDCLFKKWRPEGDSNP